MLPTTPNTVYNPATPVKSVDLDDLQAMITGRKLPNHWRWQALKRGLVETNITFDAGAGFGGDVAHANGASAILSQGIDHLSVGDRITDIGINLQGTGAGQTCSIYLMKSDGVGGHTPLEQLDIVNPGAGWAKFTKALVTPHTVLDGEAFYYSIHLPLLNTYIQNIGLALDRL